MQTCCLSSNQPSIHPVIRFTCTTPHSGQPGTDSRVWVSGRGRRQSAIVPSSPARGGNPKGCARPSPIFIRKKKKKKKRDTCWRGALCAGRHAHAHAPLPGPRGLPRATAFAADATAAARGGGGWRRAARAAVHWWLRAGRKSPWEALARASFACVHMAEAFRCPGDASMGSAGASEGARRHGEGGQLCQVTSRRKRRTAESQGGSGACQGPCASRHTRSSHMPTRHPFPAWRACKTRALLAPRFHVGAALRRPRAPTSGGPVALLAAPPAKGGIARRHCTTRPASEC